MFVLKIVATQSIITNNSKTTASYHFCHDAHTYVESSLIYLISAITVLPLICNRAGTGTVARRPVQKEHPERVRGRHPCVHACALFVCVESDGHERSRECVHDGSI